MPVGTQFSSLVIDLRAELRRSTDVSVGVDDLDSLKRVINGTYRRLAAKYDWPHLRKVFDKITLNAGQRYYDYPTYFDPDNVDQSVVWLGSMNMPIKKGIELESYSFLDPANDQRADPALAWDTAFTGTTTQIEVWPIPASSSYTMQFSGLMKVSKLVTDSDVCLLDDDLVVGFAAARLLKSQKSADAEYVLAEAGDHLLTLQKKPKKNSTPVQMGLGAHRRDNFGHPMIVIKPSG